MRKDYLLTCESIVDMSKEYLEKRGIPYICMHYTMDGKEYVDDLGQSMSFSEFYNRIDAGAMPTTSQINVAQFIAFFEPFLQQGQDILHVSISSNLSGTYGSACIAQEELLKKYPDRKIMLVDSLGASGGCGLLMDMAADMWDNGYLIDELYAWLNDNKLNIHYWFFSSNLTHFKRGGRLSASAALAGTILNICVLMNVNNEGKIVPRKKIRGKQQTIKKMLECMETYAASRNDYNGKCIICHSNCLNDAQQLADLVQSTFANLAKPIIINSLGTVIGSHCGPGTVALFFYGDERTD